MSAGRKTVIESLRIDGFGRFHDFELELSDGLNVLAGPNEAGKSTLWSFVSAMLFGFDRRNEPTRYEPVGGSAFGGELRLKTVGGRVVVRRQGSKRRVDGEVLLRDSLGAPLPDSRLDEARGQVSRELFSQVFSLTIDQLRSFGDLAGSEVSERLFAAAMQGAQRLPSALETLRKESAEVFAPKGSRPINLWLRELQGVRLQLEAAGDRPAEYAHDLQQRRTLEASLSSMEEAVERARQQVAELERLHKAVGPFEAWVHAIELQRGHETLADFPHQAAGRLEGLVKTARESAAALCAAEGDAAALDEQISQAAALLSASPAPEPVRAALREWDTVVVRARELPAALAQLESRRAHVLEALKRLPLRFASSNGGRMGEDAAARSSELEMWLSSADAGVSLQTELKSLRDRTAAGREERARVVAAVGGSREERARRQERHQQLERSVEELAQVDAPALEAAVRALHQLAGLSQEHAHAMTCQASAAAQAQALQVPGKAMPRARFPLWLAGVATLALLICALIAWPLGAGPSGLLFALVLGLAAVAAAWRDEQITATETMAAVREAAHQKDQLAAREKELHRAQREVASLDARIQEVMNAGGVGDLREAPARIASAQSQLERHQRRNALTAQYAEAARELSRVEHHTGSLEHDLARADAALDAVQSEVDARLASLKISASMPVDAALDVVTDVHRVQERWLALETERAGLNADAARVDAVRSLLAAQALSVGASTAAAAVVPSVLRDWLEADAAARAALATVRTKREAAAGPLAHHRAAAATATSELAELLSLARVDSVEAFRQLAGRAQAWAVCENERRQALAALSALGAEPALLLEHGLDAEAISAQAANARSALEAACALREHTLEALGHLRAKLERFENEDGAAGLRREEESLVLRIGRAAEACTVSALARAVLEQARERFDAEQQPRVVQRAAGLFAELTSHRYVHVQPDAKARVLSVRDAQGVSWQVEQLSRGTRELLLLAFRLAVAEDFGDVRVALPLLLDDVTVNLDLNRATGVINVLARLSKRHQILAFTCHSQVRALFQEAGAKVHEVAQRTQLSLLGT